MVKIRKKIYGLGDKDRTREGAYLKGGKLERKTNHPNRKRDNVMP